MSAQILNLLSEQSTLNFTESLHSIPIIAGNGTAAVNYKTESVDSHMHGQQMLLKMYSI